MCGIFAVINKFPCLDHEKFRRQLDLVKHRGPDASCTTTAQLGNGWNLHMVSYVLHLRGDDLVKQPYRHSNGDVLQWNGEIFGGLEVKSYECDTTVLANRLSLCEDDHRICNVLCNIQGPWSLVYYQKLTGKIWFGRDYFGRRSLLYHCENQEFVLSSTARRPEVHDNEGYSMEMTRSNSTPEKEGTWSQVQADGIFCIDTLDLGKGISVCCHPWKSITQPSCSKFDSLRLHMPDYDNFILNDSEGVKFGLENVVTSIDPFTSNMAINFPEIHGCNLSNLDVLTQLCKSEEFLSIAMEFLENLKESVQKRVMNVPKRLGCESSIGVLFSGGIDCTVLALLADEFVPDKEPIVLLNVAFETSANGKKFDVPDRITGRCALKELQTLRPKRVWNFVEINVTLEELQEMRREVISDLTYPLTTVLDDSIGCALWFAARGENDPGQRSTHNTKVLLSGLGADEQLGGYSRHRTTYNRGGWHALETELKFEVERLSSRNLGRDDRIVSDHGKEPRFPYLDENVVSFLNRTPLPYKVNFSLKRGLGEKILLRSVGFILGLRDTATLPKRAIQFGSRIAKAEGRKEKASDVCKRLL